MNEMEKTELIGEAKKKVERLGIPINIKMGGNQEAAEWIGKLLDNIIKVDEPLGTEYLESGGRDYMACPVCHRVVGASGKYCKWCGRLLRF